MVVLNRLGLKVEMYAASEIDEAAITVSRTNHGKAITQIGDITQLTREKILALGEIDLIIGGSPCTDLSLVNPNRKGLSK